MTTAGEVNFRPVALITGGARRVGRAIALELAQNGYDIALHYYRSAAEAEEAADEIKTYAAEAALLQGDLADHDAPQRMVDAALTAFGHIDLLVNNASVFEKMSLSDFDCSKWHDTMHINLAVPLMLCRLVTPVMNKQGAGCIINLSDISTNLPRRDYLAYGPSKAGLDHITGALARALAPTIRVNAVAPGIAVFPEHYSQQLRQKLIDRVPLKRAGTPEDIANAVCFLAQSPYITGQILNVDGGRSII